MGENVRKSDGTVVDQTIDAMRAAIRSGQLVPGQRLVVADITAMFAVSAGPVREAIRRLTGEGLIEIVPHRGASVRRITLNDLEEIFELRGAVEGLAAKLAAERGDDLHAELSATMAEMERVAVAEDVDGYLANNTAFHDLIYRMAQNERVRGLAAQLILPVYQVRLPHRMNVAALHLSHREHKVIAAALWAGNGNAAEAAMRQHILNAKEGLKKALAGASLPFGPIG